MDALRSELNKLSKTATFTKTIDDVDKVLDQLIQARQSIAAGRFHYQNMQIRRCQKHITNPLSEPSTAPITLAKLQNPVKIGLDNVTEGLRKVYAAQSKYGKALDKVC